MGEVRDTIDMKERRNWLGQKTFVMDQSEKRPKTFYEEESKAIAAFSWGWVKVAGTMALIAFLLLLTPPAFSEDSEYVASLGRVGAAAYGAALLFGVANMPNFVITLMRGLALEFSSAVRK